MSPRARFAALLLALIAILAAAISPAATSAFSLPRHVAEVAGDRPIAELLHGRTLVVAAIVGSIASPSDADGAVLEGFVEASMSFVDTPAADVRFVAMAVHPNHSGVDDLSKVVPGWIMRASPVHHKRGGVDSGIFLLRRGEGAAAASIWDDWGNATNGIEAVPEVLPVDVNEILLTPGPDNAGASPLAARIIRKTRCMIGRDVRELRTEAGLEDFVLNTCNPDGVSFVAWPRVALWPWSQKVPRSQLYQLHLAQQTLATIARIERAHTSFAWIDDDAPVAANISLLAFVNGGGAPVVAYVCDAKCREARDPLSPPTRDQPLLMRHFPFKPFAALRDVPEDLVRDFMHVGMAQFVAEVHEAVTGSVVALELGVDGAAYPVAECDVRIVEGDRVAAIILGTASSFDERSQLKRVDFYRSLDLVRGDTHVVGQRNRALPAVFGANGTALFGQLCLSPPSRATVVLRADRHFDEQSLPPRVEPHATLRFDVEIIGRARFDRAPADAARDRKPEHARDDEKPRHASDEAAMSDPNRFVRVDLNGGKAVPREVAEEIVAEESK